LIGELRISSRDGMGKLDMSIYGRGDKESGSVPVLSPDLTSSASLSANLSAEGVHFLNDELLHTLNTVLLLEAKVEDLRDSH